MTIFTFFLKKIKNNVCGRGRLPGYHSKRSNVTKNTGIPIYAFYQTTPLWFNEAGASYLLFQVPRGLEQNCFVCKKEPIQWFLSRLDYVDVKRCLLRVAFHPNLP